MIDIDFRQLEPKTLDNLLTEIVLREGTDYGEQEIPTETKKHQLMDLLTTGKAKLVYDANHDVCDVVAVQ